MPLPLYPSLDNNLLLYETIDFNMVNNPSHPFYFFCDTDDSINVITHLEFGRAAHRVAHALRPNGSHEDGEIVGILAHTDTVLYNAVVAGLMVAGLVPFPISPRNTASSVAALLVKTCCRRLIASNGIISSLLPEVEAYLVDHKIEIERIPSLAIVFPHLTRETNNHHFERYLSPLKRPSISDTCLILHTSGSTGSPKAIALTHLHWIQAVSSEFRDYDPPLIIGSMAFPAFHAAGLSSQLFSCAYTLVPTAVFPPTSVVSDASPVIPTPESVLKHARLSKSNVVFAVPSFIQAWVTMPDALDHLKSLEFLTYAGGPLAPKIGEYIVSLGVRLHPIYGGTEFGSPTSIAPIKEDKDEWEYVRFRKHLSIRWVPQGEGTFEFQLLACKTHRPAVLNLPDVEGYATGDLFVPHPTKEFLWKSIGRMDDIIVHASGEKTAPGPMEAIIANNPLIQNALMFGQGRNRTGVLIELTVSPVTQRPFGLHLHNQIWPSIEEANKHAPTFSKVYREMVLFALEDRPLPRSVKGTILRKSALKLYEGEIEAIYAGIESTANTKISHPVSWDTSGIETWIKEQATELIARDDVSIDVNLFEQGFDSLNVTILGLRIKKVMDSLAAGNSSLEDLSQNKVQGLIYELATIKQIAAFMVAAMTQGSLQSPIQRLNVINELITRYSISPSALVNLDHVPSTTASTLSGTVVLLTGSTGQLGAQILVNLLQNEEICRVYAFNRRSPANGSGSLLDRHTMRFKDIGLDLGLLKSRKLILIEGESTESDLGIEKKLYMEITSSVNVLIHNAWPVDFNLPLQSFESAIQSSHNLIDLVRAIPKASKARFIFISSVASAQSWDYSRGFVPEDIIEDESLSLGSGYGESKYIVERILANSGIQGTSLRFGQICGYKPTGSWPTSEWLPMLVRSSVTLGVMPKLEGVAAWLPGHSAADSVVDLVLASSTTILPRVLNMVHPDPTDLSIILASIVSAVKEVTGVELRTITFDEWISKIEACAEKSTVDSLHKLPALKILPFLQHHAMPQSPPRMYTSDKLQIFSATMQSGHIKQINEEDVKRWVKYWHCIGYLA